MRRSFLLFGLLAALMSGCGGGGSGSGDPGSSGTGTGAGGTTGDGTGSAGGGGGAGGTNTRHYYSNFNQGTRELTGLYSVSATAPHATATVSASAKFFRAVWGSSGFHAWVYLSDGKLWKQAANAEVAPVQVSSESGATNVCGFAAWPDGTNLDGSVLGYSLPGADNTCDSPDDVVRWTRLNATAADAPNTAALVPLAPVVGSNGALNGALVVDGTGRLLRVDQDFLNPVLVSNGPFTRPAASDAYWSYVATYSGNKMILILAGSGTTGEIRFFDAGTNTLSPAYGTITNRDAIWYYEFDDTTFYFVDNATNANANSLRSISLASPAAASVLLPAEASAITDLYATATHLVWQTTGGIRTMAKGTGARATLASPAAGENLLLRWVSSAGYVFYDRRPTTHTGRRAEARHISGTTPAIVHGSTNGGGWREGFVTSGTGAPNLFIAAEFAAASTDLTGASLVAVGADGAKTGIVVGTVPSGGYSGNGHGTHYGNTGLTSLAASSGNSDVFFIDPTSANSLSQITTTPDVDELAWW